MTDGIDVENHRGGRISERADRLGNKCNSFYICCFFSSLKRTMKGEG